MVRRAARASRTIGLVTPHPSRRRPMINSGAALRDEGASPATSRRRFRSQTLLLFAVHLAFRTEERAKRSAGAGSQSCDLLSLPGPPPASAGPRRSSCWTADFACSAAFASRPMPTACKSEFGANFTPLLFDVTDEAAVLAAAREVRAALNGETLAGLVNNAGIAVAGPVLELAADEFRRQMDVNVIGPIIATQAFGPLLGADPSLKGPKGRIVMISFGRRQERQPVDVGLFGLEARDRGSVGKPAPRNDAVRHRCHHHRAGRGEDADLEQGRAKSTFPATGIRRSFRRWRESANSCCSSAKTDCRRRRLRKRIVGALTSASPKVRYAITPDPMRHLITAVLPKRTVDRIIAKRLGLMPPA